MLRSDMVRFIEGMLITQDAMRMTYNQRADRLLQHLEQLGMQPPTTEIIDPVLSEPVSGNYWEITNS